MDLIAIALLTLIVAPLLTLANLPDAARISLGLPFLLYFPGYALVSAVFPRREQPQVIERLVLSAVSSLAVVLLIGTALNYSPWGLRTGSVVAFVGLFIVLVSALGLIHRMVVPAIERLEVDLADVRAWASRNLGQLPYPGAAVVGALGAVTIIALTVSSLGQEGASQPFTEFYLRSAARTGGGYPTALTVREPATVTFGIVNHEGREVRYAVSLLVNERPVDEFRAILLRPGQRLERSVTFSLRQPGESQYVRLVLQKEGHAGAYRSLHLRLDGRLPPRNVAAEVSGPTPQASPPGTAPAPPALHFVRAGETLTFIAQQYEVSLDALLSVNDIPDPDLIYPDQVIDLPSPGGAESQ